MMPSGQVRALMRQDRIEFAGLKAGQRPRGQRDPAVAGRQYTAGR
jgi:hypothetical protein